MLLMRREIAIARERVEVGKHSSSSEKFCKRRPTTSFLPLSLSHVPRGWIKAKEEKKEMWDDIVS